MTKSTYTFDEACQYLNVSSTSLTDLIAIGEVPAAKIGKGWVLRGVDLDTYLAEQVRDQTEQRRQAYQSGRVVHIKPSGGEARKARRALPVLPDLPVAA